MSTNRGQFGQIAYREHRERLQLLKVRARAFALIQHYQILWEEAIMLAWFIETNWLSGDIGASSP